MFYRIHIYTAFKGMLKETTSSSYCGVEILRCRFPSPRWPYPITLAELPDIKRIIQKVDL